VGDTVHGKLLQLTASRESFDPLQKLLGHFFVDLLRLTHVFGYKRMVKSLFSVQPLL